MLSKVNPIKQISHLGRVGTPNPNPRPPVDDVGKNPHEDMYAAVASSRRVIAPMEQLLRRPVAHYHHKFMVKQRTDDYVEEDVDRPPSAWQWQCVPYTVLAIQVANLLVTLSVMTLMLLNVLQPGLRVLGYG
jgi:hypothetical protein